MVSGNEPWKYRNGGHTPDDPNWAVPADQEDPRRNPPSAYEGTYNAIFFKEGNENERTKLVTPVIDIEGGTIIELSFYLCQVPWDFAGSGEVNDILRVYYKVAADSAWVLLHEYLDPVLDWELQTLILPKPTSTYYVAFEGQTKWGFGSCIDNIVIEDKGLQHLWIGDLDIIQPFTNYIPSGTYDVPMLRMDFKVFGNTDSAMLEHINVQSLNTSDNDILGNGVKLYTTMTQDFDTENPLGSPTSFASGTASFTGLDFSLPKGKSYVWLTFDIDGNAKHGNLLDVKIAANGILANDTLYPSVEEDPYGDRTIYETLDFEDFEGVHGWSLTGEFEVNTPTGLGGLNGNPDPSEAYSGTHVLGTDLTGLGSNHYDYEPLLNSSTSYRATSPTHAVLYYKNLNIFYRRYLNNGVFDSVFVQVSNNNGVSWNTIWENGNGINDFQWLEQQVLIPDQFARTDQLKIRYQMGSTDGVQNYSGWNIDDIYLTGEFISKDVGVSSWVYPLSGSGHSSSDSVIVYIRNYGGLEITEAVPVAYSFDGGTTWTEDNMNQNIPVGDSARFTFPTKVDLSEPGFIPSVLAKTNFPGDQYVDNDEIGTQIYIVPTYTPPHLEDFESNNGYWRVSGLDIWEYGTPAGGVINGASSGTNSWVTGLSLQYEDLITRKSRIIFEDDFETSQGWNFTGQFERGQPNSENPPYFAYSEPQCIGTDLTGHADSLFKYENGIINSTAYTATTPAFDVRNYHSLKISYASFLNIRAGDSVKLEVSPDNGSSWHMIWENSGSEIMDVWFELKEFTLHDSLTYASTMRFRFSLFYSSPSNWVAAGWYIDNFTLTGDQTNSASAYLSSASYNLNLTGLTNPVFESRLWWDTEPGVDGATLHYSLNDGDTWTAVSNTSGYDAYWNWYAGNAVSELGLDGWSGQSGGWKTVKHILPPEMINQDDVQFRFEFKADKFNNQYDGIALDDVQITEAPGDLGVLEVLLPVSDCNLSPNETFRLRLRNYGIRNLQAGDTIRIGYFINHEGEVQAAEETVLLTQSFPVGTNLDFDMLTPFDLSKSGAYNVDAFTIEVDPYYYNSIANDTATKLIEVKKPAVELGPDISTVQPDTLVLKAFSGVGGLTYEWQDGSTDSIFVVDTAGTYFVEVTNELSCVAKDTIKILELIADAGVTKLLSPVSDCELGSIVGFTVEVQNFGTDTLDIGEEVPLRYRIDTNPAIEENLILTERIYPDSTFEYTFTTTSDMSAAKSYSFKSYTDLLWDNTGSNDTLNAVVVAYGYTPIDMGPDTVIKALQYTLDAGSGYDSYLWEDGSTSQTIIIDTTGEYKVTVQAGIQCPNSDSVYLTLVYPDIAIERLINPTNACGLSAAENVELYIVNMGTDTLSTSDTVMISYQLNAEPAVNESFYIDQAVEPGDSILFSSTGTVNMTGTGIFQFTVNASYSTDLNLSNNGFNESVELYGFPDVSLGPDQVLNVSDYLLDAGSGFPSYLWQDGSTEQQFLVEHDKQTSDSTYSVTVTDENACITVEQIKIGFDIIDISPVSVSSPSSACILTNEEELRIQIRNNGSHPIVNEQIKVTASVDGGVHITVQKTLISPLNPGDSLEIIFGFPIDLSAEGDHSILAFSVYSKDADPDNDTLQVIVSHVGEAKPDLGGTNDSLGTTLPHLLDAGGDFASYLWNGISGSRTYTATEYGWYLLEVIDPYGCAGKDSLYLMLSNHLEELQLPGNIIVFPIPADDKLNMEYRSNVRENYMLEIFNAMGSMILVREYKDVNEILETLDVSGMAKGLYYLRLRSGYRQSIKQIIIE